MAHAAPVGSWCRVCTSTNRPSLATQPGHKTRAAVVVVTTKPRVIAAQVACSLSRPPACRAPPAEAITHFSGPSLTAVQRRRPQVGVRYAALTFRSPHGPLVLVHPLLKSRHVVIGANWQPHLAAASAWCCHSAEWPYHGKWRPPAHRLTSSFRSACLSITNPPERRGCGTRLLLALRSALGRSLCPGSSRSDRNR